MQRLKLFLPVLIFTLLAVIFFGVERRVLTGDYAPTDLPSALINKPLPAFSKPALSDGRIVTKADIVGEVFLLNVWATWCPSCHYEHPFLVKLAEEGMRIVSVDYKDEITAAKRWLNEKGNPYTVTLFDQDGSFGLDLGVTGAPETYLIDAEGIVRFRYQGALDERVWNTEFVPLLAEINGQGKSQ
ncbi:Thiol:disulfide interchange protein DsbE [Zhongshania aliphaticivorans]|uniref:Thiol:disulfide interchange protein DsbE n=1 Tax=Zhongshania aliphaticivorans TaxID=1470434 RepID=A0A5S9QQ55_9GAMM|nr:DsbE family thiol:disulfide interchange protein [Zhongshania aliphaticivorans]CAA0087806.1 Thiol:disulfide interchange protein DsbE [Zhongshania aliphaticivorans]CAA0115488.1 Thiol:disulfide interchange protein DsbE [Zhongshania aliphaticivorans]CAA0120242.1 Thiol:disulfide interchange protein DsbE [Zhongshania aliphaticivorans]